MFHEWFDCAFSFQSTFADIAIVYRFGHAMCVYLYVFLCGAYVFAYTDLYDHWALLSATSTSTSNANPSLSHSLYLVCMIPSHEIIRGVPNNRIRTLAFNIKHIHIHINESVALRSSIGTSIRERHIKKRKRFTPSQMSQNIHRIE